MTEFDPAGTENYKLLRRVKASRRPSLDLIKGSGAPRHIVLEPGENVMGRDAGAHVRLDSNRASRQHAFFRLARHRLRFI